MATGCPKCRFKGANILPDGSLRCAGCSHIYHPPIVYPEPPNSAGRSAAPTGGGSRKIVVLAVVAGMLIFGVVFVDAASSKDAGPDPYYAEHTTSPVPEQSKEASSLDVRDDELPAAKGPPQGKISPSVVSGRNGDRPWWLLKYINSGDVPISFPSIKGELKNAAGEPIEHIARANIYWLPPGDYVWILAMLPAGTQPDASFSVEGPKATSRYQVAWKRLDPEQVKVEPHPNSHMVNYPYLTGRVVNNSGSKLTSIRLQGIGYDVEDEVCSYATGYASENALQDGAVADFKFGTGAWQIRQPVRWEVDAWGSVQK
ncbi:MAG: hypothetical protein KDB68_02180 [Planctomycetes bacterium]|nr:hypothetical protein [Planctomycetota bacterium]MCA8944803.1 hypothetical protein [Planctomycetota bacterium]